jgi:hypothetical protein
MRLFMQLRFFCVSTILLSCFLFHAAPASAVDCGDTISSDTTLDPASDFPSTCTGLPSALNISGPAVVDMNGVVIECSDPFVAVASTGINITGNGVVLKNGGVKNCTAGVVLNGNDAKISGIHVTAKTFQIHGIPAFGFLINGDGNSVRSSSANTEADVLSGVGSRGFSIDGDKNQVKGSIVRVARDSDGDARGISVNTGTGNKIQSNVVGVHTGGSTNGIFVNSAADATSLQGNDVSCRGNDGIVVAGTRTKVSKNRSASGFAYIVGGAEGKWSRNLATGNCTGFYLSDAPDLKFTGNTSLGNHPSDTGCLDLAYGEGFDCATAKIKKNVVGSSGDVGAANCP